VNSRGGVDGHRIRVVELDHEDKVPPAIEGYARFKKAGAVLVGLYGTPQTYALTERLREDRIPGTAPGFGRADAADGTRYPYLFPVAATSWSQAAAAVKFVKDQLADLHGKKIAYLVYDNPAGREPLPVLEELAKREGARPRPTSRPRVATRRPRGTTGSSSRASAATTRSCARSATCTRASTSRCRARWRRASTATAACSRR
jgi:branched-chain amino acid transport system substrate-binding protein